MSIPNTRDRKVRPMHPGEMLLEDFMPDYGLSAFGYCEGIGSVASDGERVVTGKARCQP